MSDVASGSGRPPLRIGLCYDFRNPDGSGLRTADVYAQVLEQAALVDQLGFDEIWLTEHHFTDDGYLPSFVAAAGALAARTSRVRISTDITILPFHHPLRLAEDLVVLDNLSGGRIELGVGMGYVQDEFAAFGIDRRERVSRTEEAVEILRRAFTGERFSFHGKRFSFDDVRVTPRPVQEGGPPLWMAAMSEASARRCGRLGLNLLPQGAPGEVLEPWREEVVAAGGDPSARRVGIIRSFLVTDDKERDWPAVKAAERYRMEVYARWMGGSGDRYTAFDRSADPIPQAWIVGSADEVLAELQSFVDRYGLTDVVGHGASPGVPPERFHESLERMATEVLPRLRR